MDKKYTAFRDEIYVRPKQRSDRDMGIALVVLVTLLALVIILPKQPANGVNIQKAIDSGGITIDK